MTCFVPLYLALAGLTFPLLPCTTHQQDPAVSVDSQDHEGRDLRRVLKLEDGSTLRVRCRRLDGAWQIRSDAEWVNLDARVYSASSESELLAESRRREARIKSQSHGERIEHIRWMLEEGLTEESFGQMDRILRSQPDSQAVLELLEDVEIPLQGLPSGAAPTADVLRHCIQFGAGASPARAEVAIAHLRRFGQQIDLAGLIRAELNAKQPQRRSFAALMAKRIAPAEFAPELTRRVLLDGMGDVRDAACAALRATDDIRVLAPAVDALGAANAAMRKNAVEALAAFAHPAAVEPLVRHLGHLAGGGGAPSGTRASMFFGFQTTYVMDYDLEIAQGASIADPVLAVQTSGVVLDARSVVQITREVEILTTVRSLQQLTGRKDLGSSQAWAKWWGENSFEWSSSRLAQSQPHLLAKNSSAGG